MRAGSTDFEASRSEPANVMVFALDPFHRALMEQLPTAERYRLHGLLDMETLRRPDRIPLRRTLTRIGEELSRFEEPIHAIAGYWDFPVSCLVPMLAAERGLPGASLEAVVRCEHKYWSRVLQREVIPEHIPDFCAVDPFDDDASSMLQVPYPFWLKPVKSFNSYLGFHIDNPMDFDGAIRVLRKGIRRLARPFNFVFDQIDVPDEIIDVDAMCAIAEGNISGSDFRQCTVEGYVHHGEVVCYGIVDTVRLPGRSTFFRYHYPSTLPPHVQEKIAELSTKVMLHIGYDGAPFNIEFFWDPNRDHLWLLEINTRISQSHSDLFAKVDGQTNHRIMLDLALGERPDFPAGQGRYKCAGKFFIRRFADALVRSVPSAADIQRVEERFPDTKVVILAQQGMRLSDLPDQEPYSHNIGWVYLGADSEEELVDKYERVIEMLPFGLGPATGEAE
jgi:hypothetical protein